MSTHSILHLATSADWDARVGGRYQPVAYESEGFIHCCTHEQIAGVVGRYYVGRDDLMLLTLDESKLTADLIWEDTSGSGVEFPHIYGPIDVAAVTSVEPFDPASV